jgi:hypothetical protein
MLTTLLGLFGGKSGGGLLKTGLKVVDELYESDEEKTQAKMTLAAIEAKLKEKQLSINIQEAKHSSIFVAGWRPFIGWCCGIAIAWHWIGVSILQWIATATGSDITYPTFDLSQMYPIIMGMLGLGFARTYEKKQKVDDRH